MLPVIIKLASTALVGIYLLTSGVANVHKAIEPNKTSGLNSWAKYLSQQAAKKAKLRGPKPKAHGKKPKIEPQKPFDSDLSYLRLPEKEPIDI